jgi:hypothetical protein
MSRSKKAGRPWLGRRWTPTEPTEGSTPAAMSRWVNANEVYADEADEPQLLEAERSGAQDVTKSGKRLSGGSPMHTPTGFAAE